MSIGELSSLDLASPSGSTEAEQLEELKAEIRERGWSVSSGWNNGRGKTTPFWSAYVQPNFEVSPTGFSNTSEIEALRAAYDKAIREVAEIKPAIETQEEVAIGGEG